MFGQLCYFCLLSQTSPTVGSSIECLHRIYHLALACGFLLVALGEDGETYFHNDLHQAGYAQDEEEGFNFVVRGAPKLEAVADKVRAVGSIDPSLWTKVVPLDLEAELARN